MKNSFFGFNQEEKDSHEDSNKQSRNHSSASFGQDLKNYELAASSSTTKSNSKENSLLVGTESEPTVHTTSDRSPGSRTPAFTSSFEGREYPQLDLHKSKAMQLALLQQQSALKQIEKSSVSGIAPPESPNSSNRSDTGSKEGSTGSNAMAAAMAAAAAAAAGAPGGALPFSSASLLSPHLSTQQMQQLLSQQIMSPQQLQALMQQHQVMAAQQQQAQQLQDFYRQQQKHIQEIQMQMARQHNRSSSDKLPGSSTSQSDHNNNNNSVQSEDSKHSSRTEQTQLQQQQIAIQQLVQLQQMQAQHQQHQQAAALHQQGFAAAAAAAALAHGRSMPHIPTPELQQLWKQMTDSAALQAAAVMAAASGGKYSDKTRSGDHEFDSSRTKIFSSSTEDRKSHSELNGVIRKRVSRESSPEVSATNATTNSGTQNTTSLYSHGICKWPGCDTECADISEFRRHLNQDHRLDDKSTAQCRVQMQVVEQLEKQLGQEKDRLSSMMTHLHNMEDVRDYQMHRDHQEQQRILRNNNDQDNSRGINDLPRDHAGRIPAILKPDMTLMNATHPLTSNSGHLIGNIFSTVAGNVMGGGGASLSLPSSPNGFTSPMISSSLSHSPPTMAPHFSASASMSNLSGRDASLLPAARRRHSNAIPISAELSQNQEFYKNADVRPPYTYASLIRQAIIETHDHQLTLNEIYNWFQRKFAYFRRNTATWKSAIRTNLSLHKCFRRCEDSMGSFWTVDDSEFKKGRHLKRGRPRKYEEDEGGDVSLTLFSSKRSQSPIMRGRVDTPCYYGNPMNPTAMQIALGEHGFNPTLFAAASQAQAAALLGNQSPGAFHKFSVSNAMHGTATTSESGSRSPGQGSDIGSNHSSRKRSLSPVLSTARFNDEQESSENCSRTIIKREKVDEYINRSNSDRDPPVSMEMDASVERRNVNNNSSKYATSPVDDGQRGYSPVAEEIKSAKDAGAPIDMSRRYPDTHASEDELQHGTGDSDASGESDNAIDGELNQQQHPSSGLLATRCSFTMLHEQSSD